MEKKQDFKYITRRIPRVEGKALAQGRPLYMADRLRPGYVCIKAVHCPYPFAEVESIDASKARLVPGFIRLITWEDTRIQTNFGWNYTPFETRVLKKVCRYEGDVPALIVAENYQAAEKAASLLKIKWLRYPAVLDAGEAIEGHDVVVHGEQLELLKSQRHFDHEHLGFKPEKNQAAHYEECWGDIDEVLKTSDHVTHVKIHTAPQLHVQLETHRCYSYYDDRGFLTIEAPTQAVDAMQECVARCLGIDRRRVRVIKTQVGGGFGGKNIFSPYVWCALVTLMTKRAAVLIFSRPEAMTTIGTRHEYDLEMSLAADKDGTFRGIDSFGYQNCGAYSEISEDVLATGIRNTYSMFPRVAAMRIRQFSVFTNRLEGCAFRGFGATQNVFLLNAAARHLADELKLDLADVFQKNISRIGDSHPVMNGYLPEEPTHVESTMLKECIDRARELIGWDEKRNRELPKGKIVRGVGLGIASHASGVPRVDRGNVEISMNSDGSFVIFSGHSDIGTGSNTVILQLVAEVLEVSIDHIHLMAADSACTPFDPGTYASSNVYRVGSAAVKAAEKMKELLWKSVRQTAKLPEDEELIFKDEVFYLKNGRRLMDLTEFADRWGFYWGGGDPLVVGGSFCDDVAPSPFVAVTCEVEVDKETGCYRILHMASVIDSGRILNPINARIQALGGLTQSIGMTMFEEVKYGRQQQNLTRDLESYKIPCYQDMPPIDVEFVDGYEPTGPFGAKSLGEIATGGPAPAITDALFNALGIHFDSLPVTPEKVFRAIRQKEAEGES